MKLPNAPQAAYAQTRMLLPLLQCINDVLLEDEFSDQGLKTDFIQAIAHIERAIAKMEDISIKSQEPKSVCF